MVFTVVTCLRSIGLRISAQSQRSKGRKSTRYCVSMAAKLSRKCNYAHLSVAEFRKLEGLRVPPWVRRKIAPEKSRITPQKTDRADEPVSVHDYKYVSSWSIQIQKPIRLHKSQSLLFWKWKVCVLMRTIKESVIFLKSKRCNFNLCRRRHRWNSSALQL